MQNNYQHDINIALKELHNTKSISSALLVCNTLLEYMGVETKNPEDIELSKLKLPNAERYDRWFDAHPHFRGDRACFDLTPQGIVLEAKFFALQKRSKLFIAGAVNFTPNFEDRDYTRNDPNMKVGIDFFLTPEKDSVIVVLSNKGSLRLVELSGRLTNTQNDIFSLWHSVAQVSDKNILHATIWESFKLSSLNKKFYEGISNSFLSLTQHLQNNGVETQLSNQFANRLHGRLLFLWFLRKKNIINESREYFTIESQNDNDYYREKLAYLFFDVLNTDISDREKIQKERNTLFGKEKEDSSLFVVDSITPYLNGGLFDQNADGEYWNKNKPTFPTGFFKTLYDHFNSFNFTTDESTPEYEQIAIDPEMLGRIFESFLATLTTETGAQAKKANGAFYTPREIVSYMSRESLRQYLYTALNANTTQKTSIDDLLDRPDSEWALGGTNSKRDAVTKEDGELIINALQKITVLDPAVGSGAFPMGVLHKILSIFERLDPKFDAYETKLSILRNNIYGVDIDPTAIEISRLRAWLSIIVDVKDIKKIKPLPNLDFKFVCANTLIGLDTSKQNSLLPNLDLKSTLIQIREEYYATSSKVKKEKLQKEYLQLTHKDSLFDTEKTRQLKSYQPFENGKSCSFYDPELMHGINNFDLVIGNPPYVQLQKFAHTQIQRDLENQEFKTFAKTGDLYALFYEKGLDLTKQDTGVLCYITSNKWMRTGYGKSLRNYFINHNPLLLLDLGQSVFESALVDSNILLIQNAQNRGGTISIAIENNKEDLQKQIKEKAFIINFNYTDPWFIGSNIEQNLKKKLQTIGIPLKDKNWDIKINYGIKTGLNDAFIINKKIRDELINEDSRSGEILVPILGGKDLLRFNYNFGELYLINSHNGIKGKIEKINIEEYPAIKKYLDAKEPKLSERQDSGATKYNLRNCAYLEEFNKEKVAWLNLNRKWKYSYVEPGVYVEASLNFISGEKYIKFLVGVLSSNVHLWYFKKTGRMHDDGGFMCKIDTISNFPVPKITPENKKIADQIEKLVDQILEIKKADPRIDTKELEDQIDALVYKLYGLNEEEIKIISEGK